MTNEKMTIHEALSAVKMLNTRITDLIYETTFVYTAKANASKISGVKRETLVKETKAEYQKVTDLIKRYNAIKKAISLSNATAKVRIGEKEYTVAEAISLKDTGIAYKQALLNAMTDQYKKAQKEITKSNAALEKSADDFVSQTFGAKDSTNADDVEKVRTQYIENQSLEMLDPIGIKKEIAELEEEISVFRTGIDSALSISNATTTIEVEY